MKIFFTQRSFFVKYLLILFLYGGTQMPVIGGGRFTKIDTSDINDDNKVDRIKATLQIKNETYSITFKQGVEGFYINSVTSNNPNNNILTLFNNFDKVPFQYQFKNNNHTISALLKSGSHRDDMIEDSQKSYISQLLVFLGANPDNLVDDKFTNLKQRKNTNGQETWNPLLGLDGLLDHYLDGVHPRHGRQQLIKTHAAFADTAGFRSVAEAIVSDYNSTGSGGQVAHFLVHLFTYQDPDTITDFFYSDANKQARAAQATARAQMDRLFTIKNLTKLSLYMIFALGAVAIINHAANVVFSWISKKINTPNIFVKRTVTLNLLETISWKIFGPPNPPEDEWDNIISSQEAKEEREERYAEICWTIDQNRMLSRQERAQNKGLGINHIMWNGPPGTGKSMEARAFAAHLYHKGYTSNIIYIDGAEPSKLNIKDVVNALTLLQHIAITHYIKTGEPTIVVIDEAEQLCPSHIGGEVSWERQAFTAKLLALQARTSSPHLVFLFTTNVDVRPEHEEEAVKHIDRAVLSRASERPFRSKPSSDILIKVFIQYFKQYAEELNLEVDHTVEPYIKEVFDILHTQYDTQRDFESVAGKFLRRIAKNKIKKAVGKNKKGKKGKKDKKKSIGKISKDDLIPLISKFERQREKDRAEVYAW